MGLEYLVRDALSMGYGTPSRADVNIKVVGVGGAGCNSVGRLSSMKLNAELMAITTDKSSLPLIKAPRKILVGEKLTRGRGTGGNPGIGEQVAQLAYNELYKMLDGADMVFVLAGLGGGTGSGAGPVIADIAREAGALVVSIVTMPFKVEGKRRWAVAEDSVMKFRDNSHTVIVLDNNRLLSIAKNLPLEKAFSIVDYLIGDVISNLTDAITIPSMMNIDFSDLEALMRNGGTSTILYGEGNYYTPQDAVVDTLNNPLMDIDYGGASGALIHITGGKEMSIQTVHRIAEGITSGIRDDAEVKIGARIDERYTNKLKITTILTGVHTPYAPQRRANYAFEEAGGIEDLISVVY